MTKEEFIKAYVNEQLEYCIYDFVIDRNRIQDHIVAIRIWHVINKQSRPKWLDLHEIENEIVEKLEARIKWEKENNRE